MSLKLQSPGWWGWGGGGEGGQSTFHKGPSKALFIRAATDALESPAPTPDQLAILSFLLFRKKRGGDEGERKEGREGKKIERNNPTTKSVPLQ